MAHPAGIRNQYQTIAMIVEISALIASFSLPVAKLFDNSRQLFWVGALREDAACQKEAGDYWGHHNAKADWCYGKV
ncbi:hypothetical protein [Celeribacter marinus]|uniref:hypothetical protein n=1 Tax=Celeribacter marinus TaxID=1397108 RepID=UPI00316EC2AB